MEGIRCAQEIIDGSATILILQGDSIIAAKDRLGRLPVLIGKDADGYSVSFESFAYSKLGFNTHGYQSLDNLLDSIGIDRDKICTYCRTGKG